MKSSPRLFVLVLRLFARLSLGLLLLAGLCLVMGMQVRPAHAQSTFTVTDCSSDSQLQTYVNQANGDNDGDTITFACGGDIPLTSTLSIYTPMTIDGGGQKITLDGQKNLLPIYVGNSGSLVGNLTLNAITIANGVNNTGGGLLVGVGSATITNSTFLNNSATDGGAINGAGTMLTISNSTFTNNSASNYGGAISDESSMTISNSTVSGNAAVDGGGGIILTQGTSLNIVGSIVAENSSTTAPNDCANFGTITDQGYNMDSDSSCFTASTSLHGNPQLLALADNGGPTQTMALQQGSPTIDAGPPTGPFCPSTDQRGDPRPDAASPAETTCDIGAYESSYTASLTANGTSVSATEGTAFNGTVATGTYTGSGTLSASINWGDGTSASMGTVSLNGSNFSVSGNHTYAEEGTYSVTVSVSDGQGLSATANSSATVSDAALSANTPTHVIKGNTLTLTTIFTDADPKGAASDYTATISWGDGISSAATISSSGTSFSASGTHKYHKHGTYTVTVTIKDAGGSSVTKTLTLKV